MARALDVALHEEKLFKEPFTIKNMGGAGGNIAKSYVHQKKGDGARSLRRVEPHLPEPHRRHDELTYTDVTPIGPGHDRVPRVGGARRFAVQDGEGRARQAERPIRVGGFRRGTVPGNDQMNILRPAKAAGVDARKVQIVAFKAGGDLDDPAPRRPRAGYRHGSFRSARADEGGQGAAHIDLGARRRVGGDLAKVPTWRSMGIDVVILHWRGLFAPPGTPADVVKYGTQTLARMVKTNAWKKALERNEWFDAYADSATFRKDIEQENKVYAELLTELGMAKGLEKK